MLRELAIKNFAIIDDLRIQFSSGLSILSGETGAGKSIIINAVNLLLGSRASADLIRSGCDAAEVEAFFEFEKNSVIAEKLATLGHDSGQGLVIRRVISRTDRHRAYVNDRMSTLQVLAEITENLASISGQHAHQGLLKDDQHLLILDQIGGLRKLRDTVGGLFRQIRPLIETLRELEKKHARQDEQIELMKFQEAEIIQAHIREREDEELEAERNRLKNAAQLFQTVHEAIEELYGRQGAVSERIGQIRKELAKNAEIDPSLTPVVQNLEDVIYRLEDVTKDLQDYEKNLEMDPSRLEAAEERLDLLQKLKRKYGGSLEKIQSHLESTQKNLSELENLSESISAVREQLDAIHQALSEKSAELSTQRKAAADRLANAVEKELGSLKMPDTTFQAKIRPLPADKTLSSYLHAQGKALTETGFDHAAFQIAPNVGEVLKPLSAIASGGELSRIVLALKAILAVKDSLETVVFDEVDAGIGGAVAEVVGKKLQQLAKHHQIICITHLPQIAKFGHHHFLIQKQVEGGRTKTHIVPVQGEDRVKEIARMLAGKEITPTTMQHAKEMLRSTSSTN
jgi:DNA repair protein RecN (Recombination protein N)